jgi:hypothetical protein
VNDRERHIREKFPDQKHALDLLAAQDSEFLALCEDHDACINALEYWARSKEPEAETRIDEYRNLVRELQEEIAQALTRINRQ